MKIPTVANPTYTPITIYLNKIQDESKESSDFLGGFFIMSLSEGLKPRAVAGGPSVTKLTHNS